MNIRTINKNGVEIASVTSSEVLITDVQSALDLIATVSYEVGTNKIVLNKSVISEDFFDLKTRLAGEIIQKFINYQTKVAIVGDFSTYQSQSLKDFIYESNKGKDLFFLSDEDQAIEKLCSI
ncbi:DUF4180 domain-containing protein [Paenibacillus sp. M1]|uniref:DUF4180 domain-containing protein n=1 Tax=Paenibacillus haidiansis TaxID=1574488 RepID=A0ABU7VNQ6_9BACL